MLSLLEPFLDSAGDISPRKENPKRKEFLKVLTSLSRVPRSTKARVLSMTAEIYEIPTVRFIDIYLNFQKSLDNLTKIHQTRKSWHGKFSRGAKEIVREKEHTQYKLTHREQLSKVLAMNVNSEPKEKAKRGSLLDERVKSWLGKSNEFIKQSEKQVENDTKLLKKTLFWTVGTRSKSEEKMIKINNHKISSLEKKVLVRPLSVNLNNVIRMQEEKKEFLKKQLLFKRMKVDQLFSEKDIRKEINSIFKSKNKGRESKPKLTSFQEYVEESRRNLRK